DGGSRRTISFYGAPQILQFRRNIAWARKRQAIACHDPVGCGLDEFLRIEISREWGEIRPDPGMRRVHAIAGCVTLINGASVEIQSFTNLAQPGLDFTVY